MSWFVNYSLFYTWHCKQFTDGHDVWIDNEILTLLWLSILNNIWIQRFWMKTIQLIYANCWYLETLNLASLLNSRRIFCNSKDVKVFYNWISKVPCTWQFFKAFWSSLCNIRNSKWSEGVLKSIIILEIHKLYNILI